MVNVPSPYMVDYFNELGKHCDLTVIFEKETSSERDKSWNEYRFENFRGIILKGISTSVDKAFCPQIVKYLRKNKYDYIISSSMSTPTGIIAIFYMKLMGIPYYLESEGGFAKSGKGIKEGFKKLVMQNAKGYLSTTALGDEYFVTYGADRDKIYKYPFTSLYEKDLAAEPVGIEEKLALRDELAIKETEGVVLAVGRFIQCKGFDLLIKAAANISKDVGVYIVGGEPTDEYIRLKEECKADNLHFVGFKDKDSLAKYYKAADLFVLPTREDTWGLVINEAMAYGLPVITTDRCVAGTELVDDENGRLIPTESVEAIEEAVNVVLRDRQKLKEMGTVSLDRMQWYTFESMVRVHMDFFENNK